MNVIILKINGKAFGGWKSLRVDRSLTTMCGGFSFEMTEKYPGKPTDWNIHLGDECTVEIDDQLILTGYIEDMNTEYGTASHRVEMSGRDKTCDLIDCTYNDTEKEMNSKTLQAIIKALCSPFSITVVVDSTAATQAAKVIKKFEANEGDTVGSLIDRYAKMFAILPVSLGDGKLTLTQAGSTRSDSVLELGVSAKTASSRQSNKNRFNEYTVKAQKTGDDFLTTPIDMTEPFGTANDSVINRTRTLTILAETEADVTQCQERADWEARRRAGASRVLRYKVQGWVQDNGDIWNINKKVRVKDDFLNVDNTLLISSVSYTLNPSSGTETEITVVSPGTFLLLDTSHAIGDIKGAFDR